jgi:predicted metal-dependent hydrolase
MKRFPAQSRDAHPMGQLSLWSGVTPEQYWEVRVSERARRMSIRVLVGGRVEIVVPRWTRPGMVQGFVQRHRAWVERKVGEFSLRQSPAVDPLPSVIELAACSESWSVQRAPGRGRPALRSVDSGTLLLTADPQSATDFPELLRGWLLERGQGVLGSQLAQLSIETGLPYSRVQIRRQRTRWGSCSPGGTISLNCCLLFQSPAVVRYLLLHELCHTRHMDHSHRFWQLVERHEPDYRRLDRELTRGWQSVPAWVFAP